MRKPGFVLLFLILPLLTLAQFEQKVSINLSAGGFKTFGKEMGLYDPYQMPHYKPGIIAEGGLQVNINRHFSIMANVGVMYSGNWSYLTGEYDYLHYAISDTITFETLAEGVNKLNFFNLSLGVVPKYYLLPGRKLNPYLFAGINFNYTSAKYTDNYWKAANDLDYLPPDDTGPYDPWLESNFGIGFIPGIGVEYSSGDKFSFTISAGYSLILLRDENFKSEHLVENFNAVSLQAGIRFSFLKSKDL